jgi:rod shape-determining protein MreC
VTFGSVHDTPYVPGVPVGTITSVAHTTGTLTPTAKVRPFVDFATLGVVGVVVTPPRTDPRYSVLPPQPPKPSPKPPPSSQSPPSRASSSRASSSRAASPQPSSQSPSSQSPPPSQGKPPARTKEP